MEAGEWVWSVTRECGHEKVHALVVSLRTKRRKKKKTEREERRRRKVGLTHACPKTESAGRVKTAASSPIVGNGCACRLSGTQVLPRCISKPNRETERERLCVCLCEREETGGKKSSCRRQNGVCLCACLCVCLCVCMRVGKCTLRACLCRFVCTCVCAGFTCRFVFCLFVSNDGRISPSPPPFFFHVCACVAFFAPLYFLPFTKEGMV